MPHPGPRRPSVTLRLASNDITWLDQRARAEGLVTQKGKPNRSQVIRLALQYAQRHMPKGWRP